MNTISIIKKIRLISTSLLGVLLLASCTDNFADMNRDPGKPTDEDLTGPYKQGAFFPQMITYAYPAQENAYQMGENLIGDPYGRYLSIANTWSTTFGTFNAPAWWINAPFNDVLTKVYGSWIQVKKQSDGKGPIFAWAQIVRVTAMQRLTDMYGPIPYSKVESGGIATEYDSQEDAYKFMFKDLDAAIDTLNQFVAKNPNYRAMRNFDRVYQGDFSKWVKYANSLKLRMAMRIVYANPVLAKQKAEEAVKHAGGLIEGNADIARNAFPQNPIWTMTYAWGDARACADVISYMVGYKDPRLSKYFTKSTVEGGGDYLGLRTGISIQSKQWSNKYSSANFEQTEPTLWMCAAEVAFLKGEGALRGWDMGGSAQSFYESGIKLSFAQWQADGSDNYIGDAKSTPADYTDPDPKLATKALSKITVKWDDAAPFETKLERLMTQKWIAMYPLGLESWSEQRRTGYPRFFPVLENGSDEPELTVRLASRIPFPPDEKNNNEKNYNEAVKLLGGKDNYGTKLWWDKNPNKGW